MFFKVSLLLILQFLIEIDPGRSQAPPPLPPPPPLKVQNCTRFSTSSNYWFQFSGNPNCYYISSSYSSVDWFAANDKCRELKASLVSIHDYKTNYWLSHRNYSEYEYSNTFWTGMNSLVKRGLYKWSDNSPVQFTNYTQFTSSGDPLPLNILDQGRCVSFRSLNINSYASKDQGGWFKDDCNSGNRYICQRSTAVRPVSTPVPLPVGNCPPDWFQYANQKCIKYINGSMTFNQSRDLCLKTNGAELLSIHSQEEQDFITAYTAGLPSPFIGLKRRFSYTRWIWDDNSYRIVDFTDWGVLSDYNSFRKFCASIVTNETQPGKWVITNCTETHSVICEKALDPVITTPGMTYLKNKCKIPGFDNFIQYRNSCYSVLDSNPKVFTNFSDAEKSCQTRKGSHLVSIVDPFEEAFLKYYIKQYGKSDMYWIGLQSKLWGDTNVSQVFEWTDEWPVYYTYWDKYQPQFAGLPREECVTFAKSNGTWRTTTCDSGLAYVCKTTSNPLPKMNSDKSGVCPKLMNVDYKSLQWVDIDKRSQYCYWFSNSGNRPLAVGLQTWTDASFHCRQRNGTLVSIHSNHDSLLLKSKFTNNSYTYNTWIGLSSDPNGGYVWEDGSALQYTNWDPNEIIVSKINVIKEGPNRQCVVVKAKDGMWKQQPCSGSKFNFFICETKKIYPAQVSTQNPNRKTTKNINPPSTQTPSQSSVGSSTQTSSQNSSKGPNRSSSSYPKTMSTKGQYSTPGTLSKDNSSKNMGMSSGAKVGIAFGVIGGVVLTSAIGYFVLKRLRPNSPVISSFENNLYSSRRRIDQGSELGVRYSNRY